MSRFFEQVVTQADQESKSVIGYTVMDFQDDGFGNSVPFADHRAAVITTKTTEKDGKQITKTTSFVGMGALEIDAMIAALQAAKREVMIKRMAETSKWHANFMSVEADQEAIAEAISEGFEG